MSARSIHFRLTIWYSVVAVLGQALLAVAIWAAMRHLLLEDARHTLGLELDSCMSFVATELRERNVQLPEELAEFAAALKPVTYLQVRDAQSGVIFDSNGRFPWTPKHERVSWQQQEFLVLRSQREIKGNQWSFAVAAPLGEAAVFLNRLRVLLIVFVPVAVLIATAGGRWFSRKALRPVDEMTAAARSIGVANLSERLTVAETGDELERLGETWNSMLARLEAALGRLSRFTADASHELRTPLAIIQTTAELAARRVRPAEAYREALGKIAVESQRMAKLLEDLLSLARVDADALEMPKSAIDLVPLLEDLCSQVSPLAAGKQLRINLQSGEERVLGFGNEGAIRRIVAALLENAFKYSPEGAEIRLRLRKVGDQISLEVADCGPGIAPSELPFIFERFYRGSRSQPASQDGYGLGLSLAASLAERNDARIEVASDAEQGATFRVWLRSAA